MNSQKIARITGVLFLLTFVTSLAARGLFLPLFDDPAEFMTGGSDTRIYLGAVFEFLLIVTNIGTAVVLYPIVKRQSEIGAIGFVTARVMESVAIMFGLLSVLTVVSLSNGAAGADAAVTSTGTAFAAAYEWAFLFGPGLVVGVGNGLILGYLMYRSGLVPRRMAMFGLVGGPLLIVAFLGVLFGVFEPSSVPQLLLTVPEIVWELSLGVYLTWKGFKTNRVVSLDPAAAAPEPRMAPATV